MRRGYLRPVLCVAFLFACGEDGTIIRTEASGFFNPEQIDFGRRPLGQQHEVEVALTNTGAATFTVTDVDFDGGDAAAFGARLGESTLRGSQLRVGAQDMVRILFGPTEAKQFLTTMSVSLDGADGKEKILTKLDISAEGIDRPTVACDRGSVDFGDAPRGITRRSVVRCSTEMGVAFSRIDITPGGSAFSIENISPVLGATSGDVMFEVVYESSGAFESEHRAQLVIEEEFGATAQVPLIGRVALPLPEGTDINAVLSWSSVSTDFDLHLTKGGAALYSVDDCYFRQDNPDWGVPLALDDNPFLDEDDERGPGREIINLTNAGTDPYDIYVQYYDDNGWMGSTEVDVAVKVRGRDLGTFTHVFSACGNDWFVGRLDFSVTPATFLPSNAEGSSYRHETVDCR